MKTGNTFDQHENFKIHVVSTNLTKQLMDKKLQLKKVGKGN